MAVYTTTLLALTVVLVAAIDERGTTVSLDNSDVQPLSQASGYDEIQGLLHKGKRFRQTLFLSTAECQGACDADAKCKSFSYNAQKHDCIVSESAARFSPDFKYYSRQPWLHKKNIDDDDGTNIGNSLGRYAVFTGLMYPERTAFSERRFITLDQCKDLCDADPPLHPESNLRLESTDPKMRYPKDGCSAFSYSEESQTCLLRGSPIAYNSGYKYFAKRAEISTSASYNELGPHARAQEKATEKQISQQKAAAKADAKAEAKTEKALKVRKLKQKAESVAKEQETLEKEAEAEATQQVKAEQTAAENAADSKESKADAKDAAERQTKERTDKELAKETMLEAQRRRDSEAKAREQDAKKRDAAVNESGEKLQAKTKAASMRAKEIELKGNLKPLLARYIEKAELIANSERDLKKAISRTQENDAKEMVVKTKVRNARIERKEKSEASTQQTAGTEAAADQKDAAQYAKIVAQKEAAQAQVKKELSAGKDKLQKSQEEEKAAQAKVTELENSRRRKQRQAAKREQDKLSKLEKEIPQQETKVKELENRLTTVENELSDANAQMAAAEAKAKAAAEEAANVRYEYIGGRPSAPTEEEAQLYRQYAQEVGLAVPGDAKNPVVQKPAEPETTDAADNVADAVKGEGALRDL